MNSVERLELIRSRFKRAAPGSAKPAGMHATTHPEAGQKRPKASGRWRLGKRGFTIYAQYTGNEREIGQGAEWVTEPVKAPEKPLAPKRTKKVSPLTRIAQQLPMKLKFRATSG